ncbi:rna-directed dna polymerase from mobile element hypothetical protein [Limosa lapponica baueri]|uniref:Rna-directed dna polymerase from mobile element jockey-like n=1 Tax=Limosa lapponica baueri TaxID=1758121 RepID=A0A2I0TBQ0_LIMLA|nr:rna-directed dna polymerase from mobile element hypothetical protein [Limosa lapponica baueri]
MPPGASVTQHPSTPSEPPIPGTGEQIGKAARIVAAGFSEESSHATVNAEHPPGSEDVFFRQINARNHLYPEDTRLLLLTEKENGFNVYSAIHYEDQLLARGEDQVRDHLRNLKVPKSLGPDEIHPRVLRELADEVVNPFSILLEKLCQSGEVPADWKRGNVIPVFKKGTKEDPGNYGPVSLTSVPGRIVEQLLLESLLRHVENKEVTVTANMASPRTSPPPTGFWPLQPEQASEF